MNLPIPPGRELLGLAGWMAVAFAAAAVGAVASVDAGPFYAELSRPDWAPPGWLFGPVWSVLYALMGVAVWLVWRAAGRAGRTPALILFGVQLAANALWSWLFFAWRQGAWAFVEVMLLWGLIVATVLAFRRVRALAAALLLPYLGWVTFAALLTLAIWQRNPEVLG